MKDAASRAECLSEAALGQLLNSDDPPDPGVVRHLEACPACRARLESLAGGALLDSPALGMTPPPPEVLVRAMESLRRQTSASEEEVSVEAEAMTEPVMEPPRRSGCIGCFAGYDIVERVASGGMGVVYKGHDAALERLVAIKIMAPGLAVSAAARARFLREARAAAAVNHEHVVAIHAVGEWNGVPYLVMQFVAGRSLQARLDADGPPSLTEVLRIGMQVAQDLAAAHAQGLIHRDVKPGNILLENSIERVKITDFGLARAVDAPGTTRAGFVAGTPEYMAPEQARGEALDARADLFGLGCVLYTISTGVSPFHADSTPATLHKVCALEPPPVDAVNPALPRWFGRLVERLMAKPPRERLADATDVARLLMLALAQLQTGRTLDEVELPLGDLKPPPPPRRRAVPSVTFVMLVLAVGVMAFWLLPRSREDPEPFEVVGADGSRRAVASLVAAIDLAKDTDVIELNWDGFLEMDPLVVSNKAVRLRAGKGSRPTVVNRSPDRPWLTTDASLRIEGLELRSARADSDLEVAGPPAGFGRRPGEATGPQDPEVTFQPVNQLLVVQRAPLTLVNCRLVGASLFEPGRQPVLLLGGPGALLENCEVFHRGGGGVAWKIDPSDPTRTSALRLTNCVVMARAALVLSFAQEVKVNLEIQHCTFVGNFIAFLSARPGRLSTESVQSLFCIRRPLGNSTQVVAAHWKGRGNVYSRNTGNGGFAIPSEDEGSMSLFLELADRLQNESRVGTRLSSPDFVLTREELDRIGHTVGVNAERVGPRGLER